MSHIERYCLVQGWGDLRGLEKEVNRLIGLGWELHGPTQITHVFPKDQNSFKISETYFYQPMVKLKKKED